MATTTNYGWTTPDDTSLVKDGASAIRTLGSSVDTTTKNLNPSTTLGDLEFRSSTSNVNTRLGIGSSGQNLTVVAGAPSWAASATSVLTTTGDTLYASAANTLARLGIGTTGQVLTVAAGLPSWATSASGGMTLLSTTSLTGATVTLSAIDQTYTDLKIIIVGLTNATANNQIRIAPNSSTTISSQSGGDDNATDFRRAVGSYIFMQLNTDQQRTSANNAYETTISRYASSDVAKPFIVSGGFTTASFAIGTIYGGMVLTTSAITSLQISAAGGNMSTGTVYLYGVK